MSKERREIIIVSYSEPAYLFFNFICFMIGLLCLMGFVASFFQLFTTRWSDLFITPWIGFLNIVAGLLSPIITGYLAYRFLKPTFLLIKHWFIDPIINLFRFANKIVRKIIY